MRDAGVKTVYTFEPTDGRFGKMLRESFTSDERLSPDEECRLFTEDRREHVASFIKPVLYKGKSVICDRYYFSTMAYQGALGLDWQRIMAENLRFAPEPDIMFLLNLAPLDAVKRITVSRGESLNNFEQVDYLEKVASIFNMLDMPFIHKLDASRSKDEMLQDAMQRIRNSFSLFE
jgi:dTMP kinase